MCRVFASEFKLSLTACEENVDLNLEVAKLIIQVMKFLPHNFKLSNRNIPAAAALHEYQLVLDGKFPQISRI